MNILESQLIDQRTPFEFKHIRDISSGSYGRVIESLHKPTGQVFAMKLLEISEDSPEELIRSEIKFLIEMNQLSQKPSLFPSFYGYFLSLDENSGKNTFCLIFDLKERTLNDLIAEEREKVLYNCFEKTFFNLIHGLAYLQTMGICHRDLKPQNILIDKGNPPGLTLIDFGISKRVASLEELTQEMTIIGTENYFSPELREANSISGKIDLNPYKSDVFSLGLVLIKLGSGKLPRKEKGLKDELNKLILMIEEKYRDEINGEEEKQRKMCKIIGILKEMLEINAKLRPDFIELFYRSLRIEDSLDNIQKMILLKDSGFVLNEIPSIQKGNFLNNINENPLIKEKEEEKNQIEEEIPKDSLFERVKEYLMRENPSEIAINLVISGEINERLAFINKILILTDCLKEDLFDHIENYTELNPFIIEISRNKGNSAFESEFFINNSKKNTIKTDILTDFKHKLLEIHSYNSISYLKSQEKPFITQNISLKSLKSCFCIYSISHGFENPQFRGHLKEVLKGPSLFISLKPLIIQKYEPNYLKFIIKLTRKIACEYYTIFIKELAYCEKFKCDEKDNEKTLISKKNQKITEFEKLLKYEEDILVLLPMKKTVFFIEYNEKKVFSRLLIKIEEFLKFNLLDKTLFLMIEAGKNIEFNMKSKRRFPIEKLAELKDRTSFYLGEFEEQISVFFEKLHQGAIEDMRRNLGFFFELEGVISRGVELIRNTQDFFNKRNFVKEVFEVIIGYLQDFFRSKMIDLMFPFLTVIINETIDILGKEALEDVLQWKIGVNTIEEQSTGMEKLVLGLLLKRKQEMFSKIKGKLLISGKFLRLKEEAYNQVSKGIGFWSYEGAKLDIVKMALICLRENKLENIKETANVLTKVSMDFFKRLEEYPEERLVDKGKNEEVMLLKKEVLGVLGKDNSQKKEIWRLENLEELGDEGLKEVLQVKFNISRTSFLKN